MNEIEDRDAEIRRLKATGMSDLNIAKQIGSNETSVRERRRVMGIPCCLRNPPKPKVKKTPAKVLTRIHGAEIIRLYRQGLSDQQIATQIGISRNVIVGWRYRQQRPANNRQADGARIRDCGAYRKRIEPQRPMYMGDGPNGGCRYPNGDPGEKGFHFCGKQREGQGSYCTQHRALCYLRGRRVAV